MKVDFYGTKAIPPTQSLANAFGGKEIPTPLKGGQNTNYISGDIVFKPTDNIIHANWMAELFESLPESSLVRFPRPIMSTSREWVHDGYVAWTFLKGEHVKGKYNEKLYASIEFHKLLREIPKPDFLDTENNSWAVANLVAWQKVAFNYSPGFMNMYSQIKPHLKELDLPLQLIHGDLSGNFLYDQNLPTAIIDFSPAWAPNGFAEGIMFADAIVWENAAPKDLEAFKEIPNFEQFAWRGILRRITEQAEHITWFEKDESQALDEASVFQRAIDYMNEHFTQNI